MRFSDLFLGGRDQAQLDFVDVALNTDMRVFLDPYAVAKGSTPWCNEAHALACGFFQKVLDRLRAGDRDGARALVKHLREDNRTRLGYSQDRPQGTGLGNDRAEPFLDALENSEAFKTGRVEDIEDAALFVDRVGFDIVSDMLTNVLREKLAAYTQDQCRVLGVPMDREDTFWAWRPEGWTRVTMRLPEYEERTILLVPRVIVRSNLSLQAGDYMRDWLDHYADAGDPTALASLEKMLQTPPPRKKGGKINRGELKEKLDSKGESIKDIMARVTQDQPDAYTEYKGRARNKRPVLTPAELEGIHPQPKQIDYDTVAAETRNAAANADGVWGAARTVTGAMIAALHPFLQHPRVTAASVNGFAGVVMTNTGTDGVLWEGRRRLRGTETPNVVVLTSLGAVDDAALGHFDAIDLMKQNDAGLVFLIGPTMTDRLRKRRADLAKAGVVVVTTDELAEIAALDAGAEVAADALDALVAA